MLMVLFAYAYFKGLINSKHNSKCSSIRSFHFPLPRANFKLLAGSFCIFYEILEGLSKKEKRLMDMDNSVVTAGGGGKSIRGLQDNGKNVIKIKLKNKLHTPKLNK